MTNTINGQKLTFLISDDPVLSLMVTDEIVTDVQVESDFDADIILLNAKRNYNGLEHHLQYLLATKKSLPEILDCTAPQKLDMKNLTFGVFFYEINL